jgi:hypothetical protein
MKFVSQLLMQPPPQAANAKFNKISNGIFRAEIYRWDDKYALYILLSL